MIIKVHIYKIIKAGIFTITLTDTVSAWDVTAYYSCEKNRKK